MEYDDEEEEELSLNINGESYSVTRYNTTLFTFFGRVMLRGYEVEGSQFNHVFLQMNEDEEEPTGAYFFLDNPLYPQLASMALEHSFPQVLNQIDIPGCDVRMWEKANFGDLARTIGVPPEWK